MSPKIDLEQSKSELARRYFDTLSNADLKSIYNDERHSGVFMASPHESYFSGNPKVFIVGQEPRGWRTQKCEAKLNQPISMDGVLNSMDDSVSFNLKDPKRSKFRQFYKSASSELCCESNDPKNAALWSNQFCISYKKKNATKSPNIAVIRQLSMDILRIQFEVLKPDIVIFTTGHSRDKFLKQCFTYKSINKHTPKRLWEFTIGDTRCYRTNHPRWGGSAQFLKDAIGLAKAIV